MSLVRSVNSLSGLAPLIAASIPSVTAFRKGKAPKKIVFDFSVAGRCTVFADADKLVDTIIETPEEPTAKA